MSHSYLKMFSLVIELIYTGIRMFTAISYKQNCTSVKYCKFGLNEDGRQDRVEK